MRVALLVLLLVPATASADEPSTFQVIDRGNGRGSGTSTLVLIHGFPLAAASWLSIHADSIPADRPNLRRAQILFLASPPTAHAWSGPQPPIERNVNVAGSRSPMRERSSAAISRLTVERICCARRVESGRESA